MCSISCVVLNNAVLYLFLLSEAEDDNALFMNLGEEISMRRLQFYMQGSALIDILKN